MGHDPASPRGDDLYDLEIAWFAAGGETRLEDQGQRLGSD
jgi:hypothetical protein